MGGRAATDGATVTQPLAPQVLLRALCAASTFVVGTDVRCTTCCCPSSPMSMYDDVPATTMALYGSNDVLAVRCGRQLAGLGLV